MYLRLNRRLGLGSRASGKGINGARAAQPAAPPEALLPIEKGTRSASESQMPRAYVAAPSLNQSLQDEAIRPVDPMSVAGEPSRKAI